MKPLDAPDTHHLQAATGWLELDNAGEAGKDLDQVSSGNQDHPDVLEIRWQVQAKQGDWMACAETASLLSRRAPGRPSGWIHRSYALHEMDRSQEAHDQLLPALAVFEKNWIVPFNLACYLCRLGRIPESLEKLKLALERGGEKARETALEDTDLQPLRDEIENL